MENDCSKWLHERAYALWEDAGRPEGQHEQHWRHAEEEAKGRSDPTDETKPATGPKGDPD
jgi:hypothetical protein